MDLWQALIVANSVVMLVALVLVIKLCREEKK